MSTDIKQPGSNGSAPKAGSARDSSLHEYLAVLHRGRWLILIIATVVSFATALYTFLTNPVYESSALVLVDSKGKTGTLPFLDFTGSATTKIINELETLKSYSLAEGVAKALINRARLDGKSPIPILSTVWYRAY